MRTTKNGFTIAEMLICLGLIAVVVAIVIPAAMSKKPNRNRALFRKAYYNFERAVAELVNDETIFPAVRFDDVTDATDTSTLFAYFLPIAADRELDENKVVIAGEDDTQVRSADNTSKILCSRLAEHLNTNGAVICNESNSLPDDGVVAGDSGHSPNFVTNDGVTWFSEVEKSICARERDRTGAFRARGVGIRGETAAADRCNHEVDDGDLEFPVDNNSDYACYEVDVNGEEGPNRRLGRDPDRFRFCVTFDGKVEVPKNDGMETEYLRSNEIIE